MSLSNLILWAFFLVASVLIDLFLLPRFFRTPMGEKIGALLVDAALHSEGDTDEARFSPGRLVLLNKIRGWLRKRARSSAAQSDFAGSPDTSFASGAMAGVDAPHQINIVANSIAEFPISNRPGETYILVVSSEESVSSQMPVKITSLESPAMVEQPGTEQDGQGATPTPHRSHIQIEVSLAPGESVRFTVESK